MMRNSNPKPPPLSSKRDRTRYLSRSAKAAPVMNKWRFRSVLSLRLLATIVMVVVMLSVSVVSASAARSRFSFRDSNDTNRSKSSKDVPCDGRPAVPKHRKACGFYVWDFPSAILYKCCHNLLKDRIYEGRGGYLFVRYENSSILKLLYPCSRYSPNKCMICGGSYPDHLELWWSKHLYSPYDRYLDKTYNDALVIDEESGEEQQGSFVTKLKKRCNNNNNYYYNRNHNHNKKHSAAARKSSRLTNRSFVNRTRSKRGVQNRNNRSSSLENASANKAKTFSDPPVFHFHKRYVKDVTEMVRGIRDLKEMREVVKKRRPASKQNIMLIPNRDVMYVVPGVGGYGFDKSTAKNNRTGNHNNGKQYTRKDAFLDFMSFLIHSPIDNTIEYQYREFADKKEKNSRASNRL